MTALQAIHERLFDLGPEWAKHLEGSYCPTATLRDYSQSGSPLWYLDHGSRTLVRSDHCNSIVVRCGCGVGHGKPRSSVGPAHRARVGLSPNPAVAVREPPDGADYDQTLEFVRYIMRESERY